VANRKRVVIVGANFAGLACAMKLARQYDVTVLDSSPHFEFLPNIHELLSGVKTPDLLRLPRAELIHRLGHGFVEDEVSRIDAGAGVAVTASGQSCPFDACVVAVGGINNTFGLPGVEQFTLPFKSVDDCAAIGRQLGTLVESGRKLSIVIVGGGLEGVEALGEILRRYGQRQNIELHLVETSSQLVPGRPAALGREIERTCRGFPVTFHMGERVESVTRTRVSLASGRTLETDLTLWTGGAAPSPLLAGSGLSPGRDAWAPVRPSLQSRFFDNIFVIGDAAGLSQPVSKQAYHALDMGSLAAGNVRRLLTGARLKSFRPGPEISLISLGDIDTYLIVGKRVFASPALAPGKELIFQANMARLDPPMGFRPAWALHERYWRGIQQLTVPSLWPPSRLAKLKDLRKLA
jgi:NADH dehydrogenase FAD-containing subunit